MMRGHGFAGPLDRRRPRVFLAIVVLLVSLAGTLGAARHGWPGPPWGTTPDGGPHRLPLRGVTPLALALLLVPPSALVVLLPRRPVPAMAAGITAPLTFLLLGYPWGPVLLAPVAVLVAVLLTGPAAAHRWLAWAGAALLLGGLVGVAVLRAARGYDVPGTPALLAGAAWLAVLLLAAGSYRDRAARLAAARAAAQQSAAERERTAVTAERLRIARELHDVLAHSLSAITVQAGVGLHLLDRDPGQARSALTSIRDTSRDALTEVREVLGIVREGASGPDGAEPTGPPSGSVPLAPTWDLTGVERLAEQARADGLSVVLDVDPAAYRLPERLAGVAFRVVQESLTNVRRHASGATTARVAIRVGDALEVVVADDGSPAAGGAPGYGLRGMRERVEGVGGTLEAGPADVGWTVRAMIPLPPGRPAATPEGS